MQRNWTLLVLGMSLAVLFSGCSGNKLKVTGSVTLDTGPLAEATVRFVSTDSSRHTSQAVTDREGRFELSPDPRTRVPLMPGKYLVLITKMVDKSGNVPNDDDLGQLEAAGRGLRNLLPARYADEAQPAFTIEIGPGQNDLPPFVLVSR